MQKPHIQATVVLLIDEMERVCLARKKQAIHHDKDKGGEDIGYSLGLYNGYGGKREEEDSSILDTAIRELEGESGVAAKKEDLEPVSRVYFWKPHKETGLMMPFMDVHFFLLRTWEGSPEEGDEMGPPVFFVKEEIPYAEMMPADKHILERVFAGQRVVYEVRLPGKEIPPEIIPLSESLSLVW